VLLNGSRNAVVVGWFRQERSNTDAAGTRMVGPLTERMTTGVWRLMPCSRSK
jgi:hypothetical protein